MPPVVGGMIAAGTGATFVAAGTEAVKSLVVEDAGEDAESAVEGHVELSGLVLLLTLLLMRKE